MGISQRHSPDPEGEGGPGLLGLSDLEPLGFFLPWAGVFLCFVVCDVAPKSEGEFTALLYFKYMVPQLPL